MCFFQQLPGCKELDFLQLHGHRDFVAWDSHDGRSHQVLYFVGFFGIMVARCREEYTWDKKILQTISSASLAQVIGLHKMLHEDGFDMGFPY